MQLYGLELYHSHNLISGINDSRTSETLFILSNACLQFEDCGLHIFTLVHCLQYRQYPMDSKHWNTSNDYTYQMAKSTGTTGRSCPVHWYDGIYQMPQQNIVLHMFLHTCNACNSKPVLHNPHLNTNMRNCMHWYIRSAHYILKKW
jgi:hypothetical protein